MQTNDNVCDLDIAIPDVVNEIIIQMPAHCELECCGFTCIIWDMKVYRKYKSEYIDNVFLDWAKVALEKIASYPNIRYVNCNDRGYRGGDPKYSVDFFKAIIDSLS